MDSTSGESKHLPTMSRMDTNHGLIKKIIFMVGLNFSRRKQEIGELNMKNQDPTVFLRTSRQRAPSKEKKVKVTYLNITRNYKF